MEEASFARVRLTWILCALAMGITGCATEPWELVDVEISVMDSAFTLQTPLEFEIRAVNRGTEAVVLSRSRCPPTFEVMDACPSVSRPGSTNLPTSGSGGSLTSLSLPAI